jgi:hypothetical protein
MHLAVLAMMHTYWIRAENTHSLPLCAAPEGAKNDYKKRLPLSFILDQKARTKSKLLFFPFSAAKTSERHEASVRETEC